MTSLMCHFYQYREIQSLILNFMSLTYYCATMAINNIDCWIKSLSDGLVHKWRHFLRVEVNKIKIWVTLNAPRTMNSKNFCCCRSKKNNCKSKNVKWISIFEILITKPFIEFDFKFKAIKKMFYFVFSTVMFEHTFPSSEALTETPMPPSSFSARNFGKGSCVNDVTQFWTIFNPPSPTSYFLLLRP